MVGAGFCVGAGGCTCCGRDLLEGLTFGSGFSRFSSTVVLAIGSAGGLGATPLMRECRKFRTMNTPSAPVRMSKAERNIGLKLLLLAMAVSVEGERMGLALGRSIHAGVAAGATAVVRRVRSGTVPAGNSISRGGSRSGYCHRRQLVVAMTAARLVGKGGMTTIRTAHSAILGLTLENDLWSDSSRAPARTPRRSQGGRGLEIVHVGQAHLQCAVLDTGNVNVAQPVGIADIKAYFAFV